MPIIDPVWSDSAYFYINYGYLLFVCISDVIRTIIAILIHSNIFGEQQPRYMCGGYSCMSFFDNKSRRHFKRWGKSSLAKFAGIFGSCWLHFNIFHQAPQALSLEINRDFNFLKVLFNHASFFFLNNLSYIVIKGEIQSCPGGQHHVNAILWF